MNTSNAKPKNKNIIKTIFWFRRDLRLEDNTALYHALKNHETVFPIFIFDTDILDKLQPSDARISLIYDVIHNLDKELKKIGSSLKTFHGKPLEIINTLCTNSKIDAVYVNEDYEPYAIKRDNAIKNSLFGRNIKFHSYKDQVIFHKEDIMKEDQTPYSIFTPYSKKWKQKLRQEDLVSFQSEKLLNNLYKFNSEIISFSSLGFPTSTIHCKLLNLSEDMLRAYPVIRNSPFEETTNIGFHLRFGTISIRSVIKKIKHCEPLLNELIWREFFMMILYHYPFVTKQPYRKKYEGIQWNNNEGDFLNWINGATGFPLVDAGMRQLKHTGTMHNRVRMVTASFLVKQLLIDWRWGEAYFAEKLLDYELSSNNGNWQWVAGTGTDAAPYFRIFNPDAQLKRFDPDLRYVKKWIPEFGTSSYPKPMIDLKFARERTIKAYKAVNS